MINSSSRPAGNEELLMKPKKRSQTLRIVTYIKVEVPGKPCELQKVVKKRRIRDMSERKFNKWADSQARHQSANIMGVVNELGDDEADSWQDMSIKI